VRAPRKLAMVALLSTLLGGRGRADVGALVTPDPPTPGGSTPPGAFATTAAAPEATGPTVAPAAPAPAGTAPRRWYGWQTLALDALAVGALTLTFVQRDQGHGGIPNVGLVPVTLFWFGGPSLDAIHHRWPVAAVNLAARIAIPLLATFAVGVQNAEWSNRRAAWTAVGAMAAVSLVDAAFDWDTPTLR
jgi:hypothetical protein